MATHVRLSLHLAVGLFLLLSSVAKAEIYIAGQAGVSLPNSLSNVQDRGTLFGVSGVKGSDLELATSPLYGGKIGYFFPGLDWLGIEAEFFHTNPHIKQQPFSVTFPGGLTAPLLGGKQGARLSVNTAAINVVIRYTGKRFQPYIGGGFAMYWASLSGSEVKLGQPLNASDTSPGLNALAGSRFFFTKQVAIFGEYKYNSTTFDFGNNVLFKADYSAHNFVGGISLHF